MGVFLGNDDTDSVEKKFFRDNKKRFIFISLANDKILDWSKLKAIADDKLNVTENLKFISGRVENIAEKGQNAGFQNFLLFPQRFQSLFFQGR